METGTTKNEMKMLTSIAGKINKGMASDGIAMVATSNLLGFNGFTNEELAFIIKQAALRMQINCEKGINL